MDGALLRQPPVTRSGLSATPCSTRAIFSRTVRTQSGQYTLTFPGTQPPYVQQWNVTVQREIAANWLVSATYLGNEMTHLYSALDVNPAVYIPGNGDAGGNCFATVYGGPVFIERARRQTVHNNRGRQSERAPHIDAAGSNRDARRLEIRLCECV